LRHFRHVDEDVVGRMTVERSAEALLVQVMANETDAATEDEQTIEGTNLDILVSLFWGEGTAVSQQVDEADGNAAIDV